jgi:O-antigen/teichoic acid export membrane protein
MRTANSIRNTSFSIIAYIIGIIFNAVVRVIFVRVLSVEYLGINGLFTNVLTFLSLAELGMGNAIVFSLYKPLAHGESEKIEQLMIFFRKVYGIIAAAVAGIGLILLPFIPFLIKGYPNIDESIYLLYSLYLFNSVASYFFVYKRSLLVADQKQYIVSIVNGAYYIILSLFQITILILTKSFLVYLIIQIIFTIVQNLIIAKISDKKYSINYKSNAQLSSGEKSLIFKNVRALFFYRFSGIVVSATDNLVISAIFGLTFVGLYSNYYLIIHAAYSLISQALAALTASIGNLNVKGDTEKKILVYNTVNFIGVWIFGLASLIFFIILNPIIELWLGVEYLIEKDIVFVLIINFFLMGLLNTFRIFRNAFGLFVQGQIRPILTAIINLASSIILAHYIGIIGVFIGTAISFISINIWFDPYITYKHILKRRVSLFYLKLVLYIFVIGLAFLTSYWLCKFIIINSLILNIAVKFIICFIIGNLLFLLPFHRTAEFKYLVLILKNIKKFF